MIGLSQLIGLYVFQMKSGRKIGVTTGFAVRIGSCEIDALTLLTETGEQKMMKLNYVKSVGQFGLTIDQEDAFILEDEGQFIFYDMNALQRVIVVDETGQFLGMLLDMEWMPELGRIKSLILLDSGEKVKVFYPNILVLGQDMMVLRVGFAAQTIEETKEQVIESDSLERKQSNLNEKVPQKEALFDQQFDPNLISISEKSQLGTSECFLEKTTSDTIYPSQSDEIHPASQRSEASDDVSSKTKDVILEDQTKEAPHFMFGSEQAIKDEGLQFQAKIPDITNELKQALDTDSKIQEKRQFNPIASSNIPIQEKRSASFQSFKQGEQQPFDVEQLDCNLNMYVSDMPVGKNLSNVVDESLVSTKKATEKKEKPVVVKKGVQSVQAFQINDFRPSPELKRETVSKKFQSDSKKLRSENTLKVQKEVFLDKDQIEEVDERKISQVLAVEFPNLTLVEKEILKKQIHLLLNKRLSAPIFTLTGDLLYQNGTRLTLDKILTLQKINPLLILECAQNIEI